MDRMASTSARHCDKLLQPTALLERERKQSAIRPQSDMLPARAQLIPMVMLAISQMFLPAAAAFSSIPQGRMFPESGKSTLHEATSTLTSSVRHRAEDDACM